VSRVNAGYNTYRFRDKDPVIDMLRTRFQDGKYTYVGVAADSGVTESTLRNWFGGKTRKPQFATVQAVARAMAMNFKMQKGWKG
jgi:DNA-binding phage protein